MRILVISDIHSNYTTLKTVIDAAQPFDSILFAGDIIGFGSHPNECVDHIRYLGAKCVKGNHDHAIVIDDYSSFPDEVAIGDSMSRRQFWLKYDTLFLLRQYELLVVLRSPI